jgi:AraC-like DNA-binding protein
MLDRLIGLTLDEAQRGQEGGGTVGLRLSELMFIELLRRYADAPGPKPPGWLAGLGDPPVARALQALHATPERDWTVATLAQAAGLSRSALAERFAARVGHPPAEYLRCWRMQLAAGLLADGALPVAEVGRRVGYGSEAAFSRSFKRIAGVSPDAWRRGEAH